MLFYLIYLLIFRFVAFSCKCKLGLFFGEIPFLACFSFFVACFSKITWHHWMSVLLLEPTATIDCRLEQLRTDG